MSPLRPIGINSFVKKPTVTGGTLYSDATYYYRAFTGNGTLAVSNGNVTADIFVIAGGGGNNGDIRGGGSGAGEIRYENGITLSNGISWDMVIGAGGVSTNYGNNTTVNTSNYIANGGGYSISGAANPGGCGAGGGGRSTPVTGGASTSGSGGSRFGNAGGNGFPNATTALRAGGGGGGATQVGSNGTNSQGAKGGDGTNSFSDWGAASGLGENLSGVYWFAGGGGGGSASGNGAAGKGGATAGNSGASAQANTGSGVGCWGGGGLSGGSGLVMVRYTKTQVD